MDDFVAFFMGNAWMKMKVFELDMMKICSHMPTNHDVNVFDTNPCGADVLFS